MDPIDWDRVTLTGPGSAGRSMPMSINYNPTLDQSAMFDDPIAELKQSLWEDEQDIIHASSRTANTFRRRSIHHHQYHTNHALDLASTYASFVSEYEEEMEAFTTSTPVYSDAELPSSSPPSSLELTPERSLSEHEDVGRFPTPDSGSDSDSDTGSESSFDDADSSSDVSPIEDYNRAVDTVASRTFACPTELGAFQFGMDNAARLGLGKGKSRAAPSPQGGTVYQKPKGTYQNYNEPAPILLYSQRKAAAKASRVLCGPSSSFIADTNASLENYFNPPPTPVKAKKTKVLARVNKVPEAEVQTIYAKTPAPPPRDASPSSTASSTGKQRRDLIQPAVHGVIFCGNTIPSYDSSIEPSGMTSYIFERMPFGKLFLDSVVNKGYPSTHFVVPYNGATCPFPLRNNKKCAYMDRRIIRGPGPLIELTGSNKRRSVFSEAHYVQRHAVTHMPGAMGYWYKCPFCDDFARRYDNYMRHYPTCPGVRELTKGQKRPSEQEFRELYKFNLFLSVAEDEDGSDIPAEAKVIVQQQKDAGVRGMSLEVAQEMNAKGSSLLDIMSKPKAAEGGTKRKASPWKDLNPAKKVRVE